MGDHIKYYKLEQYLFEEVGPRFRKQRYLTALDFFCIVVWKANRAKSKTATRLLDKAKIRHLAEGVHDLTSALFHAADANSV